MTNSDNIDTNSDGNDGLAEAARRQAFGGDAESMSPAGEPTETLTHTPNRLPKRIGQYHIKRVIASGGMGTVYEAVQERPRRTVALKLMKHGIASRSALRRFEYESQILARLRHPGIAQVYEAGTHRDDSGTVPYFAMEYIVGAKPITTYAKDRNLGTRERMELFAKVCDAVHHGHQKGIIHRDLKPSNILVDAQGQVKIIDFGVARGTDSDMAVTTLQTDIGQLIGTLQYMSPEQCEADPHNIDTRSDVYALGVLFYELLCGKAPYNVMRVAMHEATRIIREQQPTRLSTLNKTLRGDVETIALKALEKDRERRYQSTTDFAQDIRRYLSNEAILAHPPSMLYQFRVLVRRNKAVFGAIAAVLTVLLGGVTATTSMYLRSEANRVKAESEATKATASLRFIKGLFGSADPFERDKLERITVRTILDDATNRLDDGELADVPEVEADIRTWLGETYRGTDVPDIARAHFARALDLQRERLGEEHSGTIFAAHKLALVSPPDEAESLLRHNIDVLSQSSGPTHNRTLWAKHALAWVLGRQNRVEEAEELFREVIAYYQPPPKGASGWYGGRWMAANNLAGLYNTVYRNDDKRMAEIESLLRSALSPDPTFFEREARDTFAGVLMHRGKLAEAEEIARENLEARRRVLDPSHSDYVETWSILVEVLTRQDKFNEARALIDEQIIAIGTSTNPALAGVLNSIAWRLLGCKAEQLCDPQTGKRLAERAVEMNKGKNVAILDTLALAHFMTGDAAKAIETQEKAISLLPPEESPLRTELEANLAKFRQAAKTESPNQGRAPSANKGDESGTPGGP